ncbi:MAG TPA: sulfate ABC transporter ATP-binding protein, partial [Actinomycetota bacterium]|nr:sulfate ABC transporter ATP-binding protein [Actinomycetota bacterium]
MTGPQQLTGTPIRVEHLWKRFGEFEAVRDVTFTADAGSITALLGPSGSGKSTVLRMIAGLEEPTAGRIWIEGEEHTFKTVQERRVGFVFQHFALFRHMTVSENVAFGLSVRKQPKTQQRARVQDLLELVQLTGFRDRYPDQLSGGQRQRVALARALAPQPKVLLLDEPFGALDARVRQELRRWLDDLHRELGVTSLLVTHDQDEALELANRIVVMHEGRVEQVGSPDEVYDEPATPFVAGFV